MSARGIKCKACGRFNDLTAFACSACGESLVGPGADRWEAARERDIAGRAVVDRSRERSTHARRTVAIGVAFVAVAVLLWYGTSWYGENYYLLGEPLYDKQPASYWVEMLKSTDPYIRRRASLAIDKICDRFNERTAREVVPALKEALNDDNEDVKRNARSALTKIARVTGVT